MKFLLSLAALLLCAGCAAPRSAWTPLTPLKDRSADSVQKAERVLQSVTVAAEMSQRSDRFVARIEIRNDSKKTIKAPTSVVLTDRTGLIQPILEKSQVRNEIVRRAETEASLARSSWYYGPRYYYAPRRVYYGRGRSRYVYVGPYYHDDWFERQIEADRIVRRANKTIATVDAEYLETSDIPPGATLRGFLHFAKTNATAPVNLSVKIGHKDFLFEFQ